MSYKSKYQGSDIDDILDAVMLWSEQDLGTVASEFFNDGNYERIDAIGSLPDLAIAGTNALPFVMPVGVLYGSPTWSAGTGMINISNGLTLTSATTGAGKRVWNRMKLGLPPALLIRIGQDSTSSNSAGYMTLLPVERISISKTQIVAYESQEVQGMYNKRVRITVQTDNAVSPTIKITGSFVDNKGWMEPVALPVTINASGVAVPSSKQTLTSSSTGDAAAVYSKVKNCFPPMLVATMTNADNTVSEVWLRQSMVSESTAVYESCTLSNGTVSGKQLKVQLTRSSTEVTYTAHVVSSNV